MFGHEYDRCCKSRYGSCNEGKGKRKERSSFNYEINNRVELTDEAAAQVVLKQIKQLKETLSLTPADRTDIINECNFSISVLQNYAPEMMDKDAIEKVIKETLAEVSIEKPTPKDKGAIMKTLMPKVKGKADGKLVNEVLASMM